MSPRRTKQELQGDLDVQSGLRVAAEDELWLHNRAMDYADNGIIITDNRLPDNPIIYANEAFIRLTGYSRAEVIGFNCRFLQGTETDPVAVAELRAGIERQEAVRVVMRNYRKNGEVFWNELSVTPVPDPNGVITHFIGAQIDVTDVIERQEQLEQQVEQRTQRLQNANEDLVLENYRRQQVEAELLRHQHALEFSNYELEQFATVAAHDLHEPLRMVSSYLRLIERRYQPLLDEAGNEFLTYALEGADRMKRLIQDLTSYARLDGDNSRYQEVSLTDVARDAVQDQELNIAETGAQIEIGELPVINGDRTQLTQLFQNLIANAIKYRSDKPLRVTISSQDIAGESVIEVRDNGIGIAKRDHERVFLVFRQVERASRSHGSGIGLAIVKKIAVRHGGRIWVESDIGSGFAFFIAFPHNNQERRHAV